MFKGLENNTSQYSGYTSFAQNENEMFPNNYQQNGNITIYQATVLHFHLQPQFKMNYFITAHHLTPHGRYELNKLTPLPMCEYAE